MQDSNSIKNEIKLLMMDVFELTDVAEIPDDISMKQFSDWTSIVHIDLLLAIEEKYDIEISEDEIASTLSLPEIVELVNKKLTGQKFPSILGQDKNSSLLDDLFSKLWIEDKLREDDTIYIHSQAKGILEVYKGNLSEVLSWWQGGEKGKKTLVFPSFPYTSETRLKYIKDKPLFSVANTSSLTGLLPEMIRAHKKVFRSAHPLLSECAVGPKAKWITQDAHLHPHPFHKNSTYARLLELDAAMIGLGVDINTNAIIHIVDDKLHDKYPFDIYMKEPITFGIKLLDGSLIQRKFIAYSHKVIKKIKPRNLRYFFKGFPHILKEVEFKGVWFYRLRICPFIEKCTEIALESLNLGKLPPWYE